jgi:hypothetical protein
LVYWRHCGESGWKEIAVGEAELRRMVRDGLGLRIEPEMGRYLLEKSAESDRPVAVFGSDARTGVPRREMVDVRLLGSFGGRFLGKEQS